MSKEITELDYALNCAAVEIDTTNARAELAALRADLATVTADRDAKDQRITELAVYAASLEAQLKSYQRMAAVRQ